MSLILMCKSDGKNALGTPVFAHVHINLDKSDGKPVRLMETATGKERRRLLGRW
jgi:hypothetical protein